MKSYFILCCIFFFWACEKEQPIIEEQKPYKVGEASRYGNILHDSLTANGERYNRYLNTAAHRELPFNTLLKVVNIANDSTVIVRVNDRGPFNYTREIDLSYNAAQELDMIKEGVVEVEIYIIGPWLQAIQDSLP